MSFELSLLPTGSLQYHASETEDNNQSVFKSFLQSNGAGLFALASLESDSNLTPSVIYWRDFSHFYMHERIHFRESSADKISPILPVFDSQILIQNAPPMTGGEYLSKDILYNLWRMLDNWLCDEVNVFAGDLVAYLKKNAPKWRQVGRVCFHLAENKQDTEYPFAFMATYVAKYSDSGNTRHIPLAHALKEYSGNNNKKALVNLLSPIQMATEKSDLIKQMVDSGDIYHPVAWNIKETYQFLSEVSVYEKTGVIIKLPDWWKKRTKPSVRVTIGQSSQKNFSINCMLDFNVNLVLGDQILTAGEWQQLLATEKGLTYIKGQWVEVDKEKLTEALTHWQSLEAEYANDGISYIEGMRLLAGTSEDLIDSSSKVEESEWSFINAGDGFSKILQQLREPKIILASQPGKALKAQLRDYQKTGVTWLYQLTQLGLGACLADDMGLGKTIQIISLLLILKRRGQIKTSILVLPASLLGNWKQEIDQFAPSLNYLMIHPSTMTKEELSNLNQQIIGKQINLVITTYGMLLRQSWLAEQDWQLVILDEAQAIKNPNTRQTKAVKTLNAKAKIALTGTPVENRLTDLWSLFDFICPGLLGSAAKFKKFIKALESREHEQYLPLRKLVQPYILRRLKTDKSIINDLPDKTEVYGYCQLNKKQAALYSKTVGQMAKLLEETEGIQRRGIVLAYLLKLKQICNHPSQLKGDGLFNPKESGKFSRLAEICEEIFSRQEKVLIFTQFREIIEPLHFFLQDKFQRTGLMLHGGVAVKKRKNQVDQFQQDPNISFFILSIKAGGTGLNLTAASHVIHFDRWWNPAVENQATDRAFRIGQKKNVLIHKFVCKGTIEEKIDALISSKKALANNLLEGKTEKLLTEMNNEEILQMVSLDVNQVAT